MKHLEFRCIRSCARKAIKFVSLGDKQTERHLLKTSMMSPSQNFLLYDGTILKIKVNELINN